MKKRGQLTIFIILGIVLLFAFGFLFFVRNLFFEAQLEKETQSKLQNVFQSESFKTYTSSCLDEVSKDAIMLIGKQGGNIYEEQGGIIEKDKNLPIQIENKNISVSYGISWNPANPDFLPPGSFATLPDYPRLINIFSQAYFGNNNLPYLCQPEGPNQETQGSIRRETCEMPVYSKSGYGPKSIQEQLSLYIAEEIDSCINITEIPGLGEAMLEKGNYEVEVIFGKENVMVNAKVPLVVNIEGETLTQKAEFSSTINVRLKQVYELAHTIVENDKKWLSFDKKSSNFTKKLENLGKIKPGFSIELSCPFCEYGDFIGYNYDDLIKITDSRSKIGKENFVFMFAVENRFPVLEKISLFNPFEEQPLNEFDIILGANNQILIKPKGYDPDEDNVSYTYEGWREDYYSEFDLSCCKAYGGEIDCRNDYFGCVNIIEPSTPPKDWTTSDEYKTTKKNAKITTSFEDLGLHNITVKTTDKANLSDWQVVEILVVDKPSAVASGFNNFSDIDDKKASIEDPYYLDATTSLSLFLPLTDYSWHDYVEPFTYAHVSQPILKLPYENHDIINIKEKIFKTTAENGLIHTINLTVGNKIETSSADSFNVTVYKCLPHRNSNTAPWPYNDINGDSYLNVDDPFMANHACCVNYDYASEDTECYRYVEYGTYEYFMNPDNLLTDDKIPGSSGIEQEEINIPDHGYQNDVYKRTFTRKCSGDRGNTCQGEAKITLELIERCDDECEYPGSFTDSSMGPVNYPVTCTATDVYHYIEFEGDGYYSAEGDICKFTCGHLCDVLGYQYWETETCCLCIAEPCPEGYTRLDQSYDCPNCCVLETQECEK